MAGSMHFRHIILFDVTKEALYSHDSHTKWDIARLTYYKGVKSLAKHRSNMVRANKKFDKEKIKFI